MADVLSESLIAEALAKIGCKAPGLASACFEWGIVTPERLAPFAAQIHHESAGFTKLSEDLRYSPARLLEVFKWRVKTLANAKRICAGGPKAIANAIYADRKDLGNGSEASGDGWRYRGQGLIHLTGKRNYEEFGEALGLPLVEQPDLAQTFPHASRIAARYWKTRGCNELADAGDFIEITRRINGGTIGFEQREATWKKFRAALGLKEAA